MAVKINNPVLQTTDAFAIFFDNIRVDQFVKDYNVTLGINTGIGYANINMVYVPDLDKIIHYDNRNQVEEIQDGTGTNIIVGDGVENMTNVRIFVKNSFSKGFVQIFGGNIVAKSITISGKERSLTFQAQDFMRWLSRTVCPIAVPFDGTLTTGDRLKWKAQGIDINKVKTVNSASDITFKGKTLKETWNTISSQTIKANKLYSNPETVAKWDAALDRVVVMGDIDSNLRRAEVVDFLIGSSLTQVDSLYVLMNDILKTLMFEFYQDRDETIRIKPPFWNQNILRNHVIDPSLIYSYTETSDFNQMYTRVVATAGLEEYMQSDNETLNNMITPVVAVTSSGVDSNSGPVVVTSQVVNTSSGSVATGTPVTGTVTTSSGTTYKLDSSGKYVPVNNASGAPLASSQVIPVGNQIIAKAIQIAVGYVGVPYVWGGYSPSGFDCSGLISYAYTKAGFNMGRQTTYSMLDNYKQVVSPNNLAPGDLLFPHDGHVLMYIGDGKVVEAPYTGATVRVVPLEAKHYGLTIRRVLNSDGTSTYVPSPATSGGSGGSGSSSTGTTYSMPSDVGSDELLEPTYLEKKYGPLIYECTQPLIKFSTSGATNSDSAYDALTKYARFMLNYLNSSVTVASIQCKAMPWIRPGFNIWVDPISIDKVYYVQTVNHSGNASGNYTSLTVALGRRRTDFINNSKMLGGLTPGKSDDIFVNTLLYKPEDFGVVCNYNDVLSKVNSFYNSSKTEGKHVADSDEYYRYFYGQSSSVKGSNNSSSSSSSTGTVINVSSYLNVRSGAGMGYGIIGKLYNGNKVTVYKKSGNWYNINYNGSSGWVYEEYLSVSTTTTTSNSSGYSAQSTMSYFDGDLSLAEIQSKLNTKYAQANKVVKDRCKRLKSIIEVANEYLKKMNVGKITDNPISTNTGAR